MDDLLLQLAPKLTKFAIMAVPGLLAITCHEVSHGFVADRLGDQTARYMGRLTFNPLKHLELFGTLMLFFIGIGWAKPVPVNFNNLRRPKRDMIWVAVAGPVTNFVLAVLSGLALRSVAQMDIAYGSFAANVMTPVTLMLAFSIYINVLLGLFNLIPVPPLDGGRVAVGLLPYRLSLALARVERFGMILIILLVVIPHAFNYVILPPLTRLVVLIAGPQSMLVFKVVNQLSAM